MCVCVCVCVCLCVCGWVCVCVCVYTHLSKAWRNPLSSLKAREGRLPLQAAGGGRTVQDWICTASQLSGACLYLTFMCAALGEEAVRTQGEVCSPSSVLMKKLQHGNFPNASSIPGFGNTYKSIYWTIMRLVGEGNGTPLQYSCLENSRDGGAW